MNKEIIKKTKIIDRCVLELLEKGFTFLYNGRGRENLTSETIECFSIFCQRIRNEHKGLKYSAYKCFECGIWCYKIILL